MDTRFEHRSIHAAGDALPRPYGNCYWLIPGRVLAGEYPGADHSGLMQQRMQALVAAGITRCFDFTHEAEALPPYAAALAHAGATRGVEARSQRFAVADFGVPSVSRMRATLRAIDAALLAGAAVYLHCRAGIGRTGTVAGCLLVEQGVQANQALGVIHDKWRVMAKLAHAEHSPETQEQRDFIARWAALRSPDSTS
ncbi:MAG: tyrosine-protein phosphatase [Burkholderiaceae bacterium]